MRENGKSPNASVDLKELPQPTKCQHCSKTFAIAVPIVGAPKDTEYIQLTAQLAQHLMDKHPLMAKKAVEQQMQIGLGVSALMCLVHFESTDSGLASWRDRARFQLHDFSRKTRISDQTIETKVKAITHTPGNGPYCEEAVVTTSDVIALVKEMRDILEERGDFSPSSIPTSNLVRPA